MKGILDTVLMASLVSIQNNIQNVTGDYHTMSVYSYSCGGISSNSDEGSERCDDCTGTCYGCCHGTCDSDSTSDFGGGR